MKTDDTFKSRAEMILITQAEVGTITAERMSPRQEGIGTAEATTLRRHRVTADDAKIGTRANTPPKGAPGVALQPVTVMLDAIARASEGIETAKVDLQVTKIKSVTSTSVRKHSNAVSKRRSVRLRKQSVTTVRSWSQEST